MIRICQSLIRNFSEQKTAKKSIIQLFKDRKLYYQSNSEELEKEDFFTKNQGKSVYCGYDPTSSSLHLGNLVSILMLARLHTQGLKPIFLIGGATGLIGDPSGKNKQRELLDVQIVHNNINQLEKQIQNVYSKIYNNLLKERQKYELTQTHLQNLSKSKHQIVNNYQFYESVNFIEFLRNIGKNFRMGPLLAKEMVSRRLESEEGLSFAQFAYSLMQGFDYSQLFKKKNCILQIGGSDQWGNILNGAQLIKKTYGQQSYAITMPLLLTKSGAKFGKSQGNALFLNQQKTPLKDVYQYFYNTSDEELQRYLSIFTFFTSEKISQIIKQHENKKQKRKGQQILAEQVVKLLGQYKHIDKEFFTLSHQQLLSKSDEYIKQLYQHKQQTEPGSYIILKKQKIFDMKQIADLVIETGATKSKKQVRRQVQAGGLYINNERVTKEQNQAVIPQIFQDNLSNKIIHGAYLILRWGKKKYYFIKIE